VGEQRAAARCLTLDECVKAARAESRRSKYHNRRTVGPAPDGGERLYDSKKEAEYARVLDYRQTAGEVLDWTPQPRIPLVVNGVKVCEYRPDFLVIYWDGVEELVEVKGFATREWRLKSKLLAALYPERRLVVVR
jgi:Protein of unknown function (DUF1064)